MTKHKHHNHQNGIRNGGKARSTRELARRSNEAMRPARIATKSVQGRTDEGSGIHSSGAPEWKESLDRKVNDLAHTAGDKVQRLAHETERSAAEATRSMMRSVKDNPIPVALTGFGIACAGAGMAWLLMQAGSDSAAQAPKRTASAARGYSNGFATSARRSIEHAAGSASELAHRAQASVGVAARSTSDTVQRLASDAKSRVQGFEATAEQTFQAHPLGVGAAVLAAGVAIGMALPATLKEAQWLGKRRDRVVGQAYSLARDVAGKVAALGRAQPAA